MTIRITTDQAEFESRTPCYVRNEVGRLVGNTAALIEIEQGREHIPDATCGFIISYDDPELGQFSAKATYESLAKVFPDIAAEIEAEISAEEAQKKKANTPA